MRTRVPAVLLLLLAAAGARPAAAAITGPALSSAAAAQLDEGLARLYGLDYAASREAFHRLTVLDPENPFGYLFEAGGIWWESSQEYGLFADTPTLQGLFEDDVDAALAKSEAYMHSDDPQTRADGFFVSGMALGTLGQWRLMKRHMLDAYFTGKKAVRNLKTCMRLAPDYADARLGLGVFDYQTAHLSGVARLGILFGLRGNEKRGLEEIIFTMEHSPTAGRQAAQLLSQIYLLDLHDDARALPVIQRLRGDFPDSPYFVFLEIMLRDRLGDWAGSLALSRKFYAFVEKDPVAFRTKWLTLVCGLAGKDCLDPEDAAAALGWFDRAVAATAAEKPDGYQTLLHLFRAELLDATGRRQEALEEYRKVLLLPEFSSAHERAYACRSNPCDRAEVLRRLRSMSKETPARR